MGFFAKIFGAGPATAPATVRPSVWVEPSRVVPAIDWHRRLDDYSHKIARQLTSDGVRPCQVLGRDAALSGHFWLIDLDVREARRSILVNHHPQTPAERRALRVPRREGWVSAHGLLLAMTGQILEADVWGSSEIGDELLEFTGVQAAPESVLGSNWSWNNTARWRPDPSGNSNLGGMPLTVQAEAWEGRWGTDRDPRPGRGTSAALKRFAESGGKTGLPRYY